MELFEGIRDALDIEKAYGFYTGNEIRGHKARCCFHEDNHPSLSFYRGRYKCFACDESGDVVDLVRHLYGLAPIDAARRINDDFHLGLEIGEKQRDPIKDARLRKQLLLKQRERQERERKNRERRDRYNVLCEFVKNRRALLLKLKHKEELTEEFRSSELPGVIMEVEDELNVAEDGLDELFELIFPGRQEGRDAVRG